MKISYFLNHILPQVLVGLLPQPGGLQLCGGHELERPLRCGLDGTHRGFRGGGQRGCWDSAGPMGGCTSFFFVTSLSNNLDLEDVGHFL